MHTIDVMPYIESILAVGGIYLLAVVSPGPDFAMILRNSLVYSRRSGVMAALGITTGILMHATYTLFGLGVIIRNSEILFRLIQAAGAFYLMYMGFQSVRSRARVRGSDFSSSEDCKQEDLGLFAAFRTGFLSNALNPMVIVLFISVFSGIIDPGTPVPVQFLYIVLMVLITFTWFSGVALFFGSDIIRHQFLRLGHWLERLAGGVLISLGLRIVFLLGK